MFGFGIVSILSWAVIAFAILVMLILLLMNLYQGKDKDDSDDFHQPESFSENFAFGGMFKKINPEYFIWKELKKANELKERELNHGQSTQSNTTEVQESQRTQKVSNIFPFSKKCQTPGCDYINKDLKVLDRLWICPKCGTVYDRDGSTYPNMFKKTNQS